MTLVTIKNLSKTYGTIPAVENLSFDAASGEIVAIAGPDGAGKTTAFRAACGLIAFDKGEVRLGGYDVLKDFQKIKPLLGYMPQAFSLYSDLSVEENLLFYAGIFRITGKEYFSKRERLYEFSGLGQFQNRRAGALSGGMKQKLALSCALIHDPQILMLDEPTTGVDPLSRRQFWEILKSLRKGGSTIIVSTPYMDEVGMADRAIFLFQGRKLAEGTPRELIGLFRGKVYRIDLTPTPELMTKIGKIEGLISRRFGASIHIYTPEQSDIGQYRQAFEKLEINIEKIVPIEAELEDTFIQFMGQ